MGEATNIEWARGPHALGATWNPWRGCHKVSPACAHCYMFRDQKRYGRDPNVVVRAQSATFYAPLKWKEPHGIFTCSWSDFMIKEADPWRDEAMDVIRLAHHHTYLILTKRTERITSALPLGIVPSNVWFGASVENARFYSRIDDLRSISWSQPARPGIRFLSIEPLLGPMPDIPLDGIGWVIVGGESDPSAAKRRPLNLDWVRQIRDKCISKSIPFFFKQGSGPKPGMNRILDGRTWDGIPKAA